MQIDPHGWWVTLPILAGLLWARFQPPDHVLKAFCRHLIHVESRGLATIMGQELRPDETRAERPYHRLFWATVVAMAIASGGSLAAYFGILPSA